MPDRPDRPFEHIILKNTATSENYIAPGGGGPSTYPDRVRETHGAFLQGRLGFVEQEISELRERRKAAGVKSCDGAVIEFDLLLTSDFDVTSLERPKSSIFLYNFKQASDTSGTASVFVPNGKLELFERRLNRYLDPEKDTATGPKEALTWNCVETIRRARLESLWTDPNEEHPPDGDNEVWWEVWVPIQRGEERFRLQAAENNLHVAQTRIEFPARVILAVKATPSQMIASADLLDTIAELRRARPIIQEFLELDSSDQVEFIDELAGRLRKPPENAPSVCILDTGVAYKHPLLAPAIDPSDCQAYENTWGSDDHHGHGSEMAGFAVYGRDLEDYLRSTEPVSLSNHVESVKILPRVGENPEQLDGDITQSAVFKAEINHSQRRRVFSLAVSRDISPNGKPTGWSASIDTLAAGVEEHGVYPRLFVVSAGNVDWRDAGYSYPDSNITGRVQNPAQAWNALTIGAFTERCEILPQGDDTFDGWEAVAPFGEMSPCNSTGWLWDTRSPNKPDLVMEGGNLAKRPDSDFLDEQVDSLWLLTTGRWGLGYRPLKPSGETSGAANIVAHMAAGLYAQYPDLWPESVRALLIHSARWTEQMRNSIPAEITGDRTRMRYLLRSYGYGVPDLFRASRSAKNDLVLVIQDELKPFKREKGQAKTDKMHVHELPWPNDALQNIASEEVRLRVTLSYFIEPNPGPQRPSIGQIKGRYSYPSHGLRFGVKTALESDDQFLKRISTTFRKENDKAETKARIKRWRFGEERDRGTIHSDVWTGTAAELVNRGRIVVYPVSGWWRYLRSVDRVDRSVRYSLIVSIETASTDVDVDFYTEVQTAIRPAVDVDR